MYEVQTGVPIPPVRRPARPRKYPLASMVVGGVFFAPGASGRSMSAYVSKAARSIPGAKFKVRTTTMIKNAAGKWEECEPEHPDAVAGVAVWRKQ